MCHGDVCHGDVSADTLMTVKYNRKISKKSANDDCLSKSI